MFVDYNISSSFSTLIIGHFCKGITDTNKSVAENPFGTVIESSTRFMRFAWFTDIITDAPSLYHTAADKS